MTNPTKKPLVLKFYIYADGQEEIERAQKAAHDFVKLQYERGRLVTAAKFADALEKAKNNPLIANILTE